MRELIFAWIMLLSEKKLCLLHGAGGLRVARLTQAVYLYCFHVLRGGVAFLGFESKFSYSTVTVLLFI